MKEENLLINNVNYKLLNTNKYKTIRGIISFVREVEDEDYTYYSMLGRLIGGSTNNYKTKKEISNKMFELYDCSVYVSTSYSYKMANTSFYFSTIDGKIVDDNDLFKNLINFVNDVMYNPLSDDGGFDEHNFNEEKKMLENQIKNIYNNKDRYAYYKLLDLVDPNDNISKVTIGNLDTLAKINRKSLYEFYKKVLNDSFVTVGVIGDITMDEVTNLFKDFNFKSRTFNAPITPVNINYKEKVNEVTEEQRIVQAKLYMGYRVDIDFKSRLYAPLIVFTSMFGGMFASTLFQRVREQNSLCYDIQAESIVSKKLFVVSCGLDKVNIDKTKKIINEELDNYRSGKIDKDLLKIAIDTLTNELNEMQDSSLSYLSFKLENIIYNRESIEEIIENINNTKIEDIISVAKLIKEDTIYCLVPGEKDE